MNFVFIFFVWSIELFMLWFLVGRLYFRWLGRFVRLLVRLRMNV